MYIVFGDYLSEYIVTEGGWYHTDEAFPEMKKTLVEEKSDVTKLLTDNGYLNEKSFRNISILCRRR